MSAGLLTNKVTIIKMINRKNEPQRKLRDYLYAYTCIIAIRVFGVEFVHVYSLATVVFEWDAIKSLVKKS